MGLGSTERKRLKAGIMPCTVHKTDTFTVTSSCACSACLGNSSAHVQGRRQLDLISGLHVFTTLTYMYHDNKNNIQVAALAPLALLLVLEARCAHFVIAHFNNFFVL